MKSLILLLLISIPVLLTGQELKLASTLMSSGGTIQSDNPITLSRWRLVKVDQLILESQDTIAFPKGAITAYPNPVVDNLVLKFNIPEKGDYEIEIIDILGQKLFFQRQKDIYPGDAVRLDFLTYAKGIYLVKVTSLAQYAAEIIKIQK